MNGILQQRMIEIILLLLRSTIHMEEVYYYIISSIDIQVVRLIVVLYNNQLNRLRSWHRVELSPAPYIASLVVLGIIFI